jgi:predicted nucleic acid-binding protein
VSLFVDTSVWSLALRRDAPEGIPEVAALREAITLGDTILTTGLVLQELVQGFAGPKARVQILERFSAVPLLVPDRDFQNMARTTPSRSGIHRDE